MDFEGFLDLNAGLNEFKDVIVKTYFLLRISNKSVFCHLKQNKNTVNASHLNKIKAICRLLNTRHESVQSH